MLFLITQINALRTWYQNIVWFIMELLSHIILQNSILWHYYLLLHISIWQCIKQSLFILHLAHDLISMSIPCHMPNWWPNWWCLGLRCMVLNKFDTEPCVYLALLFYKCHGLYTSRYRSKTKQITLLTVSDIWHWLLQNDYSN